MSTALARMATAIHWPECWDTAAYPTAETALSEVYAHFKCTNEETHALAKAGESVANKPGTNTGHGHVWQRPDGVKARCGGPGLCKECSRDARPFVGKSPPSAPAARARTDEAQDLAERCHGMVCDLAREADPDVRVTDLVIALSLDIYRLAHLASKDAT